MRAAYSIFGRNRALDALKNLQMEVDKMTKPDLERHNFALGIKPGQMVETRIIDKDGKYTILQRVAVHDLPPAVETCDGRLPSRLEAVPVPPIVLEGAYVRYLRRMAGMKNDEIARLLAVTSSTISNWENGVTRVPADQWEQLVDLLTVT